jgi:glutamate/tyrosine decarboxylase-like PLP-dependent enzyme
MEERIYQLEQEAKKLELTDTARTALDKEVLAYSHQFLDELKDLNTFHGSNQKSLGIYDHELEEEPVSMEILIHAINDHVMSSGINAASGGHMGYIPGGGLYPSALGDYMVDVFNRYAGIFFAAPGAVRLENLLIQWMNKLMGFPNSAIGNLTSGGSISILIAVVTARDAIQLKAHSFDKAVVYCTGETHHALYKALRIAGLGDCVLRQIPMDQSYRMLPEKLDEQIQNDLVEDFIPLLINATIGTTNTGAVDPIDQIATIAQHYKIWFHVDAAYGGFFKLIDSTAHLFAGIEKADSIVLDPHKSLFLPFGTGAILIKNAQAVFEAHHYQADYMQDMLVEDREISPADVSPELTKHFRGMRMWLPLKLFGLKPIRAALEEKMLLAQYFHREVQKMDNIEVGPDPPLSICMFRMVPKKADPNKLNQQLIQLIQQDGRIFLSSTTIDGVFWIRVCVLLFRTHMKEVKLLLELVEEKVKELV